MTEPITTGVSPETVQKMLGITPNEVSQACGTVGLVSQPLARYTDFWLSFQALIRPASTKFVFRQGMDVTGNYNGLIEDFSGDWLWIMGDDHTFRPDVLMNLIAHDVDVVVPLCLKKDAPFDPVVYEGELTNDKGQIEHIVARLPEHGLHEIHAAGSAGMLIRRHVLEALEKPIFTTEGGMQNEDLLFCRRVREAGFRLWCSVDDHMGHISPKTVYPVWQGNRWGSILEIGNGQFSPVFAFTEEELDAMEAEIAAQAPAA